jgi:hypothetical protein
MRFLWWLADAYAFVKWLFSGRTKTPPPRRK